MCFTPWRGKRLCPSAFSVGNGAPEGETGTVRPQRLVAPMLEQATLVLPQIVT